MITVNLYYTGTNGSARKFAQEMESSGTADLIRAEKENVRYEYFFPMNDPETVPCSLMRGKARRLSIFTMHLR